jgi:hypothetical protein
MRKEIIMIAHDTTSDTVTFHQALAMAETQARHTLPSTLDARLSGAVALVKEGKVFQNTDLTWAVASATTEGLTHTVNGTCTCPDSTHQAPKGLCKHRLAMFLARRALELMQTPQAPVVPEDDDPEALVEETPQHATAHGIAPEHIALIKGKPFVKYAGLLTLAHQRGLVRLEARFLSVTADLALAEATATFADGRVFTEAADATPGNCGEMVRMHVPRMALVRAKARALRDALCIDMAAVEELE